MNSDVNPDLRKDLSAALVRLKDVQRQAQALCGRPQALPEDLPAFFLKLVDRINHLETELAAVSDLLLHQEKAHTHVETELQQLSRRLLSLEEDEEKPIVLQVVKRKRSVGKKTQND